MEHEGSARRLLSTTDAQVWAAEFVRLHGGDEGLMLGWFANAIETGRTAGQLPLGAIERMAGRLSTEPPYAREHPETLVPLARDLLDAARDG